MPRGVYDRSLTKEQRAALKNKAAKNTKGAAPTKRKYTRRAPVQTAGTGQMSATADGSFVLMGEIRNNLGTLTMVRDKFGDLPSITSEVDAQIGALGHLREKLFSVEEAPAEQPAETVEEEAEAPTNGVAPALQTTVPLPPPPVAPVIPAPH